MSRKSVQRFCDNDMHRNKRPKARRLNPFQRDALSSNSRKSVSVWARRLRRSLPSGIASKQRDRAARRFREPVNCPMRNAPGLRRQRMVDKLHVPIVSAGTASTDDRLPGLWLEPRLAVTCASRVANYARHAILGLTNYTLHCPKLGRRGQCRIGCAGGSGSQAIPQPRSEPPLFISAIAKPIFTRDHF